MNRFLFLIVLVFSISNTASAQAPIVKHQVGISINNLIWSNNQGVIMNYEVPTHYNKALNFKLGYLFHTNDYVQTVSLRTPEHMEPHINSFGGWEFGGEFKFYRAGRRQTTLMNKYLSFYFDYRNLSGETKALVVPEFGLFNNDANFDGSSNNGVYKNIVAPQNENILNTGVKIGILKKIARIAKNALVIDTYLGLAYQLYYTDYHISEEDYSGRIYINNLKNGFERSYSGTDLNKVVTSNPVLQFGMNLNLMY